MLTDTSPAPALQWAVAWTAALGELDEIPRNRTAFDRYTYADLAAVLSYVRPILARHGLYVSQIPQTVDGYVTVATVVGHDAGHRETFPPLQLPAGPNAQAIGSAITYARRYALMSILGLATEDDDGATAGTRISTEHDATVIETFNALTALDPAGQAKLRELAADHNRKLSQAGLAADPAWLAVVRGFIDARTPVTPTIPS